MRWQGRRESSNVEDRRSSGGGFGGGRPTGILGLIIILVGAYYGVDLSGLVGEVDVGTTQSSPLQSQQEDQLFKLSKVVLGDTEEVWTAYFSDNMWSLEWSSITEQRRQLAVQDNLPWDLSTVRTINGSIWICHFITT